MNCQKSLFALNDGVTFLNGAYMSPLLKASEEAGIAGLRRKRTPSDLTTADFFDSVSTIRSLFSKLINNDEPNRVVVAPSASYILANAAKNTKIEPNTKIVMLANQFPSNYYIWERRAKESQARVLFVSKPKDLKKSWTDALVEEIDSSVSVISIPTLHWEDGTLLDLEPISKRSKEVGAILIIDGTQSIGALPFDQSEIKADVIVSSTYKWLLGPYSSAIGYYGPSFDHGHPIEESWLNRIHSDDFQYLTNYQNEYRDGARQYEVGEAPDFIKMPMLEASLSQLLLWKPKAIQDYCKSIVLPIIKPLTEAGFVFNNEDQMAYHLFGIRLPKSVEMSEAKSSLKTAKISVSFRQDAIRVSPNVYNTHSQLESLKRALLNLTNS